MAHALPLLDASDVAFISFEEWEAATGRPFPQDNEPFDHGESAQSRLTMFGERARAWRRERQRAELREALIEEGYNTWESRVRQSMEAAGVPVVKPVKAANDNGRFNLTWFDDITDDDTPKVEFIKGVFGVGEFTTVSGLPGTGKSVIVTDMACHVAAGREWHGRRVRKGLVVYIAAERASLTKRRMKAFKTRHGVSDLPLLVLSGRIDLTTGLKDAADLAKAVNDAAGQCGEAPVWIIIDTLTRTFGPGDQNTSKDMTKFVGSCDEITRLTGAHVTVIHHTAWSGERGKGAIDLDGAVDASFLVKKSGKTYSLACNGANDGEEGEIVRFGMEGVAVGVDEDGEVTFAPVVVPAVDLASKLVEAGKSDGLKGNALKALTAIHNAMETEAIDLEDSGGRGVPLNAWRVSFYGVLGREDDSARRAFDRARSDLSVKLYVADQDEEYYWPIGT